jgi:hypothetical protein
MVGRVVRSTVEREGKRREEKTYRPGVQHDMHGSQLPIFDILTIVEWAAHRFSRYRVVHLHIDDRVVLVELECLGNLATWGSGGNSG